VDGDGLAAACDCNDASAGAWKTPGEARDLMVFQWQGVSRLAWAPPADTGGPLYGFDVIRSSDPNDFATAGTCLPIDAGAGATTATDAADPPAGGGFFYLVRAKNACPSGLGPLGSTSAGTPHTAPACP